VQVIVVNGSMITGCDAPSQHHTIACTPTTLSSCVMAVRFWIWQMANAFVVHITNSRRFGIAIFDIDKFSTGGSENLGGWPALSPRGQSRRHFH